ncbi:MAG TPA: hypothetical protein PL126_03950, partial [Candidatus Cloacimonadota bacterium]|nr:hypothetical protein [Candidatus Cloacimonadota bacterium]
MGRFFLPIASSYTSEYPNPRASAATLTISLSHSLPFADSISPIRGKITFKNQMLASKVAFSKRFPSFCAPSLPKLVTYCNPMPFLFDGGGAEQGRGR